VSSKSIELKAHGSRHKAKGKELASGLEGLRPLRIVDSHKSETGGVSLWLGENDGSEIAEIVEVIEGLILSRNRLLGGITSGQEMVY
jgi:hypothetical protein